jgi:hypothetical protein
MLGTIPKRLPHKCPGFLGLVEHLKACHTWGAIAAPGKFEVKRLGAVEHKNDNRAVSSSSYSASNFLGAALWRTRQAALSRKAGPRWPGVHQFFPLTLSMRAYSQDRERSTESSPRKLVQCVLGRAEPLVTGGQMTICFVHKLC